MNACNLPWQMLDSIETERKRLQIILEERHFDFQDEQVQEASRRMDRIILSHYRFHYYYRFSLVSPKKSAESISPE